MRRSHRRGIFEQALSRLGWYPYRCYECRSRFFLRVEDSRPPVWRVVLWAGVTGAFVMVAAAAAILVLISTPGNTVKTDGEWTRVGQGSALPRSSAEPASSGAQSDR